MPDALSIIWGRADAKEAVYTGDEMGASGNEAADTLIRLGVLSQATNAASVVCDACDGGHVEEVVFVEAPAASGARGYIYCSQEGRVRVPGHRVKRWAVDFRALANSVAQGLDLAGAVEELAPERIWFLGKGSFAGRSREIFLSRGMTWADAPQVIGSAARLQASSTAVVLIAGGLPPDAVWQGDKPRVVPLNILAHLKNGNLSIDRAHLASLLAEGRRKAPAVEVQSFPTPPGTKWPEVRLQLSEHRIRISARGKTKELSFQEAGFEERRRMGVPDRLWILLTVLAARSGFLQGHDATLDDKSRVNLKQYMSDLRERIQSLVPNIDGDPIPHVKEEQGYRAAFTISTDGTPRLRAPQGAVWSGVSISEARAGVIRIAFRANEAYGVSVYGDEDGAAHGREAAEREVDQEQEFNLASLNLADAQGKPDRRGNALIAVLRGKGVVLRPQDDDDTMLELNGFLCDWTGIADSAFDFAPNEGKWVAKFESSSAVSPSIRPATRRR